MDALEEKFRDLEKDVVQSCDKNNGDCAAFFVELREKLYTMFPS